MCFASYLPEFWCCGFKTLYYHPQLVSFQHFSRVSLTISALSVSNSWLLLRKTMIPGLILLCSASVCFQNTQSPLESLAVTLVEVIVVFNQWNMYGLTILFASWILQWRVVHMRIAPWSVLKIWDNKVSKRWCVSLAPIVRSPNCPHAGRRFLIRHQQPQHQAHSRRSPISTESHHEIGLQTGKCFIFSLQLTLIRRIPGPSGHIALFTHPCSFFIHEKQWHVCLEWLPAWNFLKVVSRNLTTWQTSDVIKWRINS